jgi:hypothetical protein
VKQQPPAIVVADGVAIVEPVRASLARGGGLVAPALTLVNVLGYALTLVAAHVLDKNAYGELGAYLGVLLVALVPALALQAVVARSVATRPAGEPTLPVVLRPPRPRSRPSCTAVSSVRCGWRHSWRRSSS